MKSSTSRQQTFVSTSKRLKLKKNVSLYIMLAPLLITTFVFAYLPMPGLLVAFMDYDMFKGVSSPWVGFSNIVELYKMPAFMQSVVNTLKISVLNLIIVFPMPILFALLLNELRCKPFKKLVQTISYLPHFLSWIAVIGMAYSLYATYGIINDIRVFFGGAETMRIMYLSKQNLFLPNIILLTLWKSIGWNSVIYLATISGIDAQLYEVAQIDGAGKFKQCIHVTLPGVLPTAVMLFILQIGSILNDNLDLVYGLQNAFIDFETISTMVYKSGIANGNYSMSTALGFLQSTIGFVLIILANSFSKKVNNVSLW